MKCRVSELRYKEIIDVADGCRYGFVGDAEVDLETGEVTQLIVHGRLRLFGLLGRWEDAVFPWSSGRRIGAVPILGGRGRPRQDRRRD